MSYSYNNPGFEGPENITINLGRQSGLSDINKTRGFPYDRVQQESGKNLEGEEGPKYLHTILAFVLPLIIIGIIYAVLQLTGAFNSSQHIYGDTTTCCNDLTSCSTSSTGVGNCMTGNGCKCCNDSGL